MSYREPAIAALSERESGHDRKKKRGKGETQLQPALLWVDFSANHKELGGDLHTPEQISISSFRSIFGILIPR